MKHLEQKINESKHSYSASLRRLEVLNTEMHERRGMHNMPSHHPIDPRQVSSTGTSPEMRRAAHLHMMGEDVDDVDSLQLKMGAEYRGSTGSLPSIGGLSNPELCQNSESDVQSAEMLLAPHDASDHRRCVSQDCIGRTPQYQAQDNQIGGHASNPSYTSSSAQELTSNEDVDMDPSHHEQGGPSNEDSGLQGLDGYASNHDQEASPSHIPTHSVEDLKRIASEERIPSHHSILSDVSRSGLTDSQSSSQVSGVASSLVMQSITTACSRVSQEGSDTTLS
jgi:hypothetical protein